MVENDKLELTRRPSQLYRADHRLEPAVDLGSSASQGRSTLHYYWDIARRRQGVIAASVLALATVTTIYTFKMQPVYEATVQVGIESETPQLQSITNLYQSTPTDEPFLKTQVKVLRSDNLAWETIQQLGLATNPAFRPSASDAKALNTDPREAQGILLKWFRRALSVDLSPNTHVVEVSFESTDPYLAAQTANTLVNNYVEYNFHEKYDATRQATAWMEQQLDELKAKVEKSQQALVTYERENAIVNVSDKQNVVEQRLSDLSKGLSSAESDLAQKESLRNLVKSNQLQVAFIAENELLQRLQEKYADLKAQYTEARAASGANYPRVVRLGQQVDEIQSLIDQERSRNVERVENDYRATLGRVRLLRASVAAQKGEAGRLSQLLIQHNILKHEFESNQQLYESLLQHLKDATVSAGLRATNINVVDPARPPAFPVRPKVALYLALGVIGGLLVGITLAFAQEGLERRTVKTAEDVEKLVDAPTLALIPMAGSAEGRRYLLMKPRQGNGSSNGSVALAVSTQPTSPLAESYRTLRTSVLFSTRPPPRAVLVTSAAPGEGKTCTALNLSIALAEGGQRVVLVDGDMRRPGISGTLGMLKHKGLSGVLAGVYPLAEALYPSGSIPNLWVLPAGPHPPNPASLICASNIEAVLRELREQYDQVVVDSPPVLMVTDATLLAASVDGVVMVVESGVTSPGILVHALRTLETAAAKVLGVVVNKVDFRSDGYHYSSYYRYYDSYYGSSEPSAGSS